MSDNGTRERVAAAIFAHVTQGIGPPFKQRVPAVREAYLAQADAALGAVGLIEQCSDCGSTGPFRGITYPCTPDAPEEYDTECCECRSLQVAESPREAFHALLLRTDTQTAELLARAEAAEKDAETVKLAHECCKRSWDANKPPGEAEMFGPDIAGYWRTQAEKARAALAISDRACNEACAERNALLERFKLAEGRGKRYWNRPVLANELLNVVEHVLALRDRGEPLDLGLRELREVWDEVRDGMEPEEQDAEEQP